MNNFNRLLLLIILELVLFILPLNAQTSVFINTNKDCYTFSELPNQNFNEISLVVENNNPNYLPSLIYFDISSIPQNATIVNAYLLLYRWDETGSIILRFGRLQGDVSWTETGVTYNNMPYPTTPPPFKYFNVGNPNTYSAYDVTEFVQAWHAGSYTNNGFSVFTETQGSGVLFYAREYDGGSKTPKLNVVYEVPLPNPPTNLSANAVSSSQINLNWTDNSNNEDGFQIWRKTGSGGTWSQITTVPANNNSYNNAGLSSNTTYYYRVRAWNIAGNSGYSNEANATTQHTIPIEPSNLTAVSVSSSQITLNWTDNSNNEDGFQIWRKTGSGGTWSQITTVPANNNSYNNTGLSSNTTYYYRVRAWNIAGNSGYSNEANATTQHTIPIVPSNLTTAVVSSSQINLNWTDNSNNEDGFKIERKTGSGGSWSQIASVGTNVTSYNNTELNSSTVYCYKVRAYNNAGNSDYSNEDCANTPDPVGIIDIISTNPEEFSLMQNYPNPFNPSTHIEFSLKEESFTTLIVFDISGKEVKSLIKNESLPTGTYRLNFDASDLPSGIYFYRIQAGSFVDTKKMILLK